MKTVDGALTCPTTRKIGYLSRARARVNARVLGRRHHHRLWVYRCPYCRRWHLTKQK